MSKIEDIKEELMHLKEALKSLEEAIDSYESIDWPTNFPVQHHVSMEMNDAHFIIDVRIQEIEIKLEMI